MQFITAADYLLLPFYLVIIYLLAAGFRNRKYPVGHPWRPYFLPGLTVKIAGAVFISLLYQYYYGYGDTVLYFTQSQVVNSAFFDSPVKWFNLVFRLAQWYDGEYQSYISQLPWYLSGSNFMVTTVASLIGLFTFNTYLPSAVLFGTLSFTGIWALFRTFAGKYPELSRQIAIAILFVPSVFIWGSGIFKDTICIFSLGWLTHVVFRIFVERKISLFHLALLLLCGYLIADIKIYILLAYLPSLVFWVLSTYSSRIKIPYFRPLIMAVILIICGIGMSVFSEKFSEELGQYSLDKVAESSSITRDYISKSTAEDGSAYDLGKFDPTLQGMISKAPQAINVTLFRPYLWEAKKSIVFLNALEALIIFLLTLKVLITVGPLRVWKAIVTNPDVQFCLIFTIIFAFAVGISSYNFGSLSRYRIPCIPFYILALILIYYSKYDSDKRFISLNR